MRLQANSPRSSGRSPAVVGLHGTAGDDGVSFFFHGIGNAEFQFPGFVAPTGSGQQIIAFDIQIDIFAQSPAQCRHGLYGGGCLNIFTSGKSCKIHGVPFYILFFFMVLVL
jgi:hypothetical protein